MSTSVALAALAALGAVYARGAWRLAAGRPSSIARWRVASFLGGALAVAVALLPPVHHLAERSLTAHMVQHLLLLVVGGPLMALGRPLRVLGAAGPPASSIARRVAPLVRRLLDRPLHVWAMHTTVVWFWHAPAPSMAALHDPWLHAFEHVSLLGIAVLFWLVVVEPGVQVRVGSMPAAGYLFAAGMQCGILGALLTLSETPWYADSASASSDPLVDQHLAGVLMWIPTGLVYLGATLAVLARPLGVAGRGPR